LITMVGRFSEISKRPIGEMLYDYPVIDLTEIKKWDPDVPPSPRFHFGVGIGTSF
jgi:starvation-inducible outer membrane lipoprotein